MASPATANSGADAGQALSRLRARSPGAQPGQQAGRDEEDAVEARDAAAVFNIRDVRPKPETGPVQQ